MFVGLGLCLAFTSANTYAATLTYSDNLIIRDIDDKAVEHGVFSKKTRFELHQGEHTIVVKYKDVFEDLEFAEDRLVKSDYFVVKFSVDSQKTLFLTTSEINNLAEAENFVKSPVVKVITDNKAELVLKLETLSDYDLAKQVAKVVTSIAIPSSPPSQGLNSQGVDIAEDATKNKTEFEKKVIEEVDAVPMLKFWWQKASAEQQVKFLEFVKSSNTDAGTK